MQKKQSIREVSFRWKEDKQQYVKSSTMSAYTFILERYILPTFGNKQRLSEAEVQDFVLQKLADGMSQRSVKTMLVVLKMIQRYGERQGILPYVEWKVRFPTEQTKRELKVLSATHQRRIMQHTMEHFTFRNLGIYICLCTGMRIGEICALKWSDINMQAGTISICRTIERIYVIEGDRRYTKLVTSTPKTKSSIREIPMSRELLRVVRPLRKVMNDDFFVLTNDAKPTEPRIYRNYYKQLLRQLGIPDVKFHGLRHSFATRCIESQCDYKTVSAILGHSDISTTLNLYVHPSMEQKKRCIDKVCRLLPPKLGEN